MLFCEKLGFGKPLLIAGQINVLDQTPERRFLCSIISVGFTCV